MLYLTTNSMIERPKIYTGSDLESCVFRPLLSDNSFHISTRYNFPVPTKVHRLRPAPVLYSGGRAWGRLAFMSEASITIPLSQVRHEIAYQASEYDAYVTSHASSQGQTCIWGGVDSVHLESAELSVLRASLASHLSDLLWWGDTSHRGQVDAFDGLLKRIIRDCTPDAGCDVIWQASDSITKPKCLNYLRSLGNHSSSVNLQSEASRIWSKHTLAYFISRSVHDLLVGDDASGHMSDAINGIPVYIVDTPDCDSPICNSLTHFMLLADVQSLVMALNTSDFPVSEARMGYNQDAEENCHRVTCMAGTGIVAPHLLSMVYWCSNIGLRDLGW